MPELAARGAASTAVELPFTGFADDVAAVRAAIGFPGGRTVVCGHSYAGLVVGRAVGGLDTVDHVVYLAAILSSGLDAVAADPPPLTEAIVAEGDRCIVDPARAGDLFYGDSDEADAAAYVRRLRPMVLDVGAFAGTPAPPRATTTYVVCSADRALPPALQRRLAAQCDHVVEWPTDHSPFLTRPELVAELLAGC